jgi:hypothetical protein
MEAIFETGSNKKARMMRAFLFAPSLGLTLAKYARAGLRPSNFVHNKIVLDRTSCQAGTGTSV